MKPTYEELEKQLKALQKELELLRNAVKAAEGIRFHEDSGFVVAETMNSWFFADHTLWEFYGKRWEDRASEDPK